MEMEKLKKKRASIKASITRMNNYIQGNQSNLNDVKVRMQELENVYAKYGDVQDEIDMLCTAESEVQAEERYRGEIENQYCSAKVIWSILDEDNLDHTMVEAGGDAKTELTTTIETLIQTQSTMATLLETLTSQNSQSASLQYSNSQNNTNYTELRLPPIQIPEFEGHMSNWVRFRDLFVAMVHSKTNLSDVEKLEYLQSKLKGEPSTMIKHLTPTNDNYKIAWELIMRKYNKPDRIKRSYFDLLFDQRSLNNSNLAEVKRFYNNLVECYNALKALEEPVDSWDSILLYLIEKKLDIETITLWYRLQDANEVATFQQLLQFLEKRVTELENLQQTGQSVRSTKPNKFHAMVSTAQSCPICNIDHFLYNCQKFMSLDINKRKDVVRKNGLCFNCLQGKHFSKDCKSSTCRICTLRHNTLLHSENNPFRNNGQQFCDNTESSASISINSNLQLNHRTTLLPTAIIMVRNRNGKLQPCRALIDSGAQSSLISEACAQRLQLTRTHDRTLLCGIGGNHTSYTKGKIRLEIYARPANKTIYVQTYCLSNLTQYLPSQTVTDRNLDYFNRLQLADPNFRQRNKIDIILGADLFAYCILPGKITHPSGSPTAINTIFGWMIMGNVNQTESSSFIAHVYSDFDLQKFWDIEECSDQVQHFSPEEVKAEQHYKDNVQRQSDGRYMVRLPFKSDNTELGESRTAALKRLQAMERKFTKDETLKTEFHQFMNDYIDLKHMEVASHTENDVYYMPHHAVLKPTSTTTKLRVVFDASCKSTNNLSLNDHLLVGPVVQNDLYTILLKFRIYSIGVTADVEKMYRQVLVHPEDRSYQRILWRSSTDQQPVEYNLCTVTYGTAAAPFLATRTLQQIADDNSAEYPNESKEIIEKFYVDDYMSSVPDSSSADILRERLCQVLSSAGFNLRKWSSNSEQFRNKIPVADRAISISQSIDDSETVKTLGLLWNTTKDCFQYSVCFQNNKTIITKRTVLSDISKIYDPIGWLAPVVVVFKIFMQKLWLQGVNWDHELTDQLRSEWLRLRDNIQHITLLQIPRWLNFNEGDKFELHGFADSSELAYAAAIYVRVVKPDGSISTCLLTSKTRVAPIRQITLPRLELCAAQLMVKLLMKVKRALNINDVTTFGWTDSTVVLAWISDHPKRWKTFIANRTSYIIQHLPATQWSHITTKQNPADLATRGLSASDVINSKLWWEGPTVLQSAEISREPYPAVLPHTKMEERKVVATITSVTDNNLINRYSDFGKLVRITSLVLRYVNNCRTKLAHDRKTGFITTAELNLAHDILVKKSQHESFHLELHTLTSGKSLSSTHILAPLIPFVDAQGKLRVGGRLENAAINYDQKHPHILHKDNYLTQLIIREYHLKYLHAGTRQLQYQLGLKYWIPGVTRSIKRIVYQCTQCMRFRQKPYQQRMGNLPACRLQAGSAFLHVGIDFAGPLLIKTWKGRGSKSYKCWIAVFVCLSTKALHLEAVTELTTSAFLASLRRFISRRGKPLHIYTDNGTNFIGCNQQLKELYTFLNKAKTQECINKEVTDQRIHWHFIPPSAPNFGGIWEAGVKSVKFHLKRVLGNSLTTYEELTTLLCQIEYCLNSRPLCLKFEGDPDPLTPAHFLILRPMSTIPDENLINTQLNRLTRWQYIQHLVQQFWSKWSKEYLSQLQRRPKWIQKLQNLQENDVVLLKEDNLPPSHWLMGKVTATHPGQDGIVRVVTVQTKRGPFKRPISKLCPLFLDD